VTGMPAESQANCVLGGARASGPPRLSAAREVPATWWRQRSRSRSATQWPTWPSLAPPSTGSTSHAPLRETRYRCSECLQWSGAGSNRRPSAGPKIDLGWARGSTRWRVSVAGFLAPWSTGRGEELAGCRVDGFDGDFAAEAFQALDVVAGLPAGAHALLVVVGAEIGVDGCRVRQQRGG
jgi:hypothetical protein